VYRDLGSTHGSFVNDRRVDSEVVVRDRLNLRLGPVQLSFNDLAGRIGRELDALIPEDDEEIEIRIIAKNPSNARMADRACYLEDTVS
jgi:pSer/pThr/pTyr-binding forkhead associated (FHA) protein